MNKTKPNTLISAVEYSLFFSRWVLLILYLGLSFGLALYCYKFVEELIAMMFNIKELTTELTMLSVLGLVDIAMVANLVIMVAIGGYSIFIREINPAEVDNRPRFMNNITAGGLKTKMATSLIGVSSIHLLKKFIEAASVDKYQDVTWKAVIILVIIHLVFVVSALCLGKIDTWHPATPPKKEKHEQP